MNPLIVVLAFGAGVLILGAVGLADWAYRTLAGGTR